MNYVEILEKIREAIFPWLLSHGIKVIALLIGALIVKSVLHFLIERAIKAFVKHSHSKEAEEKRENTLIRVFSGTSSTVIWLVVALMILSELGIEIGPLIAAAGVIGLAIGFGGQYLIKDLFAGLFILLENQYRVGDVVTIAGLDGKVEDFNLRVTVIRDMEGVVHYVPNGQIATASNKTQEFAKINLVVGVGYSDDIDKVEEIVNKVGKELVSDDDWKGSIRKAPEFLRIDNFGDSSVDIKIVGEVDAGKQWEITGELRRRLKKAFDKEGIEIPFPQRVIHNKKEAEL